MKKIVPVKSVQVQHVIYGLTNDLGQVLYVGRSYHPYQRYQEHVAAGHIVGIAGLAFLETIPVGGNAYEAELKWMNFFKMENLHNKLSEHHSAETRSKIRASLKSLNLVPFIAGKKHTLETREKMSAAARNRSPETRAKMSAAQTGRKHTLGSRAKLSILATQRGRTDTHRANLLAATLGKKRSPETRARMSEAARQREARKREAATII